MKRHLILYATVVVGLMATLPACAMPLTYSAEPMQARVIDADTKQPLAGVIVTANWQLEEGTPGGNIQVGQLMVMEAVTDKDGKFTFPGWGPKTVWKGFLVNEDPQLLLFKSGYEYQRLYNKYNSTRELRTRKVRRSDWNGKTLALKPFKGAGEGYAEHVHQLDNDLEWARYGKDCEWKQVPRMLVELHHMSKHFVSQGIKPKGWQIGARIREVSDVGNQKRCGSAEEFFRGICHEAGNFHLATLYLRCDVEPAGARLRN